MGRGVMGLRAAVIVAGALLTACGGGGGGGGSGPQAGPMDWGIPFLPTPGARSMTIHLRNVAQSDAATATLQGYKPDGTPYAGPVAVTLDGNDEHFFDASIALSGNTPAGGFVWVHTPSRLVEVAFNLNDVGKPEEESSRAWSLDDLSAPLPTTTQSVAILPHTTLVQVSNATAGAIVVAVTAYRGLFGDPTASPSVSTPAPIALAAWETKSFTPDVLTGITGFSGGLKFTSASPFLAAGEEDGLGVTGVQVNVETRFLNVQDSFLHDVFFGQETFGPNSYTDFEMVFDNLSASDRAVTIRDVRNESGASLILGPITFTLAGNRTCAIRTTDLPIGGTFGDATLETTLRKMILALDAPRDVDVTLRQFDPVTFQTTLTARPQVVNHGFVTLDVFPEPLLASPTRTITTVLNPSTSPISVRIEALIPQPDGFEAGRTTLATLDVPAHGQVEYSPDGAVYRDRDLNAVPVVGLLFTSNAAFATAGRRETRTGSGLLILLSPTIFRGLDAE